MDKINKDIFSSSGVTFGECNVRRLMFADNLALLNSNKSDLEDALKRLSDACLDAGMKISTAKTEIMCMSRHPVPVFFFKQMRISTCLTTCRDSLGHEVRLVQQIRTTYNCFESNCCLVCVV